MLILGTRKISVFRKQCIVGYYIGTSKKCVSAKLLDTLYVIKSVYIKFLELIKNRVYSHGDNSSLFSSRV